MKQVLIRFIHGFCFSIAITMTIQVLILYFTHQPPMLPEFMARFDNSLLAFGVQLLLVGCMSGTTSAGTILFEAKKIGLVAQSLLFLVVLLSAWIPVSCIAWGFHKYLTSMFFTIGSIIVTYAVCWVIQYRMCKKEIAAINAKLSAKEG